MAVETSTLEGMRPADKERRTLARAGLFVTGGLLLAALVILVLGKAHSLFDRTVSYRASFVDVDGLQLDSPVRLGGLDVGQVKEINFSSDLADKRVMVKFEVSRRYAVRLRQDTVASVGSRGVLGDKTIDLSLGTAAAPPLEPGAVVTSQSSGDLSKLMKTGTEIADNLLGASREVKNILQPYSDPKVHEELIGTLSSLHTITNDIANGQGAMHALLHDPQTARDLQTLLASAGRTVSKLDTAVAHVDTLLDQAQNGQGTVHELFYGKDGQKAIAELSSAAGEVSTMLHDARTSPNSAVHQLVYGDSAHLVADLSATMANVKSITDKVNSSQGSLGALVNDPSVYDDLREVLGNVKRNHLLRALVRYSISNRDQDLAGVGGSGNVESSAK